MKILKRLIQHSSRGQSQSSLHPCIDMEGRHSYGMEHISIFHFGDGHKLRIGSFNSIAPQQVVFLGGNHRVDWTTTYPFGHLLTDKFPSGMERASGHPRSKGDVIIEHDV